MIEKPRTASVEVVIEYLPVFVGKMACPYCHTPQEDYLDEAQQNKILLHACNSCNEDFYIDLPNFPPLK